MVPHRERESEYTNRDIWIVSPVSSNWTDIPFIVKGRKRFNLKSIPKPQLAATCRNFCLAIFLCKLRIGDYSVRKARRPPPWNEKKNWVNWLNSLLYKSYIVELSWLFSILHSFSNPSICLYLERTTPQFVIFFQVKTQFSKIHFPCTLYYL